MPIVQLNSVGYDTTQDLRRLIDKYNENFRQLDWLLNQKKLDGQNLSPQFYETIVESPDIIDAIQKAIEAALASLGTASIQSLNLNDAYIGVPYSQILSVPTHEMAVWEMVEGDLPPGIELTETGELVGTPTGPLDENGVPLPISDDMYKVSSHMFAVRAATSVSEYFGVFYIDLCRKPGTGTGGGNSEGESSIESAFRVLDLPTALIGHEYDGAVLFKHKDFQIKQVFTDIGHGILPPGIVMGFRNLPQDIEGNAGAIIEFTGTPVEVGTFDFRIVINTTNAKGEQKIFKKSYRIQSMGGPKKVSNIVASDSSYLVTFSDGTRKGFSFVRDHLNRVTKVIDPVSIDPSKDVYLTISYVDKE